MNFIGFVFKMPKKSGLLKTVNIGFCAIVILCVAFTVKYSRTALNDYFFETYEFPAEAKGLKIGEIISLNLLKNKNGTALSESTKGKILLLGVVDPDCGACQLAKDQISLIQEELQSNNVEYILVSFTSNNSEKFFNYTDSFKFPTDAFLWSDFNDDSSDSLQSIVVPSHILINSNGKILKHFTGTNKERSIRRKMAAQIVKDVLNEKQRFKMN